jgi:hypothetical protein
VSIGVDDDFDRGALAPSVDDLPRTPRRWVRRVVTGVIAVTVLALVGVGVFGHLLPRAVQPARPLTPPTLPFSVASVPTGYSLGAWFVSDDVAGVQYYTSAAQFFVIAVQNSDPTAGFDTQTPTTVDGHPALFSVQRFDQTRLLSWQIGNGKWFEVTEPKLADANLYALADSIRPTPTRLPTTLRIAGLPDNLKVNTWQGTHLATAQDTEVTLCPPGQSFTGADTPPPGCVVVHLGTGAAPAKPFESPSVLISTDSTPVAMTLRNRLPVISDNGQVVTRQVDSTHWVAVHSVSTSPSLVTLQLAIATTVG